MGSAAEAVIAAGLTLDADERALVAHRLLESVEQPDSTEQVEINPAWHAEIERRVQSIVDGTAELLDGPESHAQLRAELAARRR